MTYTLLLPIDGSSAVGFDSEHDTLDEAIAAAGGAPGAVVEQSIPGGTSIVFRNQTPEEIAAEAAGETSSPAIQPPAVGPIPQWVQFAAALTADPVVNTLIGTAAATAPVLHLMLGVGLGQAAKGDAKTFTAAWAAAVSVGLVDEALIEHMQDLAADFDLPSAFIAGLNP